MKSASQMRLFRARMPFAAGFTLVEILVAVGILGLVLYAIYASWTAILRASKVGQEAAASVQRSRIALRVLEDALTSAQSFGLNQRYYGFVAEGGDKASLSFVSRLSESFPRSGKFGDLSTRRVMFSVEQGRDGTPQLVLRQTPLIMEFDTDEKEHPLVLARNVREFSLQFWDMRLKDWVDEWKQTNQLPRLVLFTLKVADNPKTPHVQEEVSRIVSVPSQMVQAVWQMPRVPGVPPGVPGPPGAQVAPDRLQGGRSSAPRWTMKTRFQWKLCNQAGIALVIVMISVTVLAVLAGGFAYSMKVETRLARNGNNETQLEWLGRSGVEYARWILAEQMRIPNEPYDALNQVWAGGPGGPGLTNSPLMDVQKEATAGKWIFHLEDYRPRAQSEHQHRR
jgi:type II secretion system protein J